MRKLAIPCLWFCLIQPLWAQTPARSTPPPRFGPELRAYVDLSQWSPTQAVAGDLNGDERDDFAVVLVRDYALMAAEGRQGRTRALLVLLAGSQPDDYDSIAMVPGILPCTTCLGILSRLSGEDVFELEIADGRLSLGWMAGNGELKSVRLTFAYDKSHGTLGLIADEKRTFDPQNRSTTHTSQDYVTGRMEIDGRTFGAASKFIPIWQVSASDY